MGKITEANHRKLKQAKAYENAGLTGLTGNHFTESLDALFLKKGASTQQIVAITGLSKSYINKLRNSAEREVNPSRNVILNIGLALDASESELNALLKAAQMAPLYARREEEALIIWCLLHHKSYHEILEMLEEKGFGSIFEK